MQSLEPKTSQACVQGYTLCLYSMHGVVRWFAGLYVYIDCFIVQALTMRVGHMWSDLMHVPTKESDDSTHA